MCGNLTQRNIKGINYISRPFTNYSGIFKLNRDQNSHQHIYREHKVFEHINEHQNAY